MYNQKLIDNFMNPENVGEIENPDGVGEVGNPTCGDLMKLTIRVERGFMAQPYQPYNISFQIEVDAEILKNEEVLSAYNTCGLAYNRP